MVTAYVLIKANTGDADRLKQAVSEVEGVAAAYIVAGDVDLIARVEVDTPAEVKEIAASSLQSIAGIANTETYVAMD